MYLMKERNIQLNAEWDVIVVGGGPAGCTAAIASAREGAKTLLIEATGCLGGMGTAGLVPAWCPFSNGKDMVTQGIGKKIFEEVKKGMLHVPEDALDWVPIDHERLKRVYDEMVTEAGATVLFNTMLSAVDADDNGNVQAIITSNKAGLTAYSSKVYIDCTADGDLAVWAGAEYLKGDEDTGEMQPATLCFLLSNVNERAYLDGPKLNPEKDEHSPAISISNSDDYPLVKDAHMCSVVTGPTTVGFNACHLYGIDNTDPMSVSRGLIEGRKLADQIKNGLAKYHPKAFGNAYLVATGSLMGIRETRRIVGDYVLTIDDYANRRSFEDEISRNSYFIDVHPSLNSKGKKAAISEVKSCGIGESHGIPYRCLTPKKLKNVLVSGRNISCDRYVLGSIRVMPPVMAFSEAAGMAAALATKIENYDVHKVDTDYLRQRLREEGAYLP